MVRSSASSNCLWMGTKRCKRHFLTFRYERGKAAVPFDRSQRLCDMYGTDGATGCHSDIKTNAIELHHMETAQQISSGQL